ncbi:MAG TPA: Rieske 2Fe-2S domain-containing protein [Chloroflexota bacterium]|nr:Rieske 2Fe-2S domain-containing protein [Chloroflexota bacterium]
MLTKAENELLTQTGPGTPAGELLRRYWQPAALSREVPPGGAPLPVRLLGEDLVLFRDQRGRPGLLGLHCAHRGADLSYGRIEDGGLRCLYHGWLYDVAGNCLEQPGEPSGSEFYGKVSQRAYPCHDVAGIIFAYMGPGEPPLFPNYEALQAAEDRLFVRKFLQDCNYLQGTEGNIDPAHQSFLHRKLRQSDDPHEEFTTGTGGTSASNLTLYREDLCPTIEVEETSFGLRLFAVRENLASEGGKQWVKILNFVFPSICFIPGEMGRDGYNINWQVPIDDTHHWKWMITYRRSGPLDREDFCRRYAAEVGPDFRPIRNQSNHYLQDRDSMRDEWFSGLGTLFPIHDIWATNSQGRIQDRSQEHLGYTDKAITASRRLLLRVIRELQAGKEPPHVIRAPAENRFPDLVVLSEVIPQSEDWRTAWQQPVAAR